MVHAVLDAHAPGVAIIDVTHGLPPHDVRAGALTLWRAARWLAPAVILGVVDPGVGTPRRAVALEVADADSVLVGPDNGLLLPAALLLGRITAAVELPPAPAPPAGLAAPAARTAPAPAPPGATFHGRDIFAPAAGRAAAGTPVEQLGRRIDPASIIGEPVPEPVPGTGPTARPGEMRAEVLWVDRFGNAQLNLTPHQTGPGPMVVQTGRDGGEMRTMPVVASYGAIGPDQVALVIDSYGLLSVSCDRRPAAEHLGLRAGDPVRLWPAGPAET